MLPRHSKFSAGLNGIQSYTDYTPSQNIFQTVFGEIYNEGKISYVSPFSNS